MRLSVICTIMFSLLLSIFSQSTLAKEATTDSSVTFRADLGVNAFVSRLYVDHGNETGSFSDFDVAPLIGFGVTFEPEEKHHIGTKIEYQRLDGNNMLSFRALDYKYQYSETIQLGYFFGGARYDYRTTAFGYLMGLSSSYRPINSDWGLTLELQYYDKIARDKLLPEDREPSTNGPDTFFDVIGLAISANYYF